MSVEISSGIMYGYKMNGEEAEAIKNYLLESDDETLETYYDEYFHDLNTWGDGSDGAVFGIDIMSADEGEARLISSLKPTSAEAQNMSWAWYYNSKCEQIAPNAKLGMYLCTFVY